MELCTRTRTHNRCVCTWIGGNTARQFLIFLQASTRTKVVRQAMLNLDSEGFTPRTHRATHPIVVAKSDQEMHYRVGLELLSRLNGVRAGEDMDEKSRHQRNKQVTRLMQQMQAKRKLLGHIHIK